MQLERPCNLKTTCLSPKSKTGVATGLLLRTGNPPVPASTIIIIIIIITMFFFPFCFVLVYVLREHVTGCRRKLPKRTSDGREKGKMGEEVNFCILPGGSQGGSCLPQEQQEPPTHTSPRAMGHQSTPREVGKCHDPPIWVDSQLLTCDQRWAMGQQWMSAHGQAPWGWEGSGLSPPKTLSSHQAASRFWEKCGGQQGPSTAAMQEKVSKGISSSVLQAQPTLSPMCCFKHAADIH